jgi:hypothetical protein
MAILLGDRWLQSSTVLELRRDWTAPCADALIASALHQRGFISPR